ncbi:7-carboxy-7-deazaguanine synthase QueE [Chryseolinea serpens]|uniref:7-carboxy-7-deazaguanine synthase QueE n=1 Tax=Chryseolinea serpens TaxID=947013 RepID=UPI00093382C9|nr:7-carboxy-7-deazaguanine synthase QueE [Chryseolinea serpens]
MAVEIKEKHLVTTLPLMEDFYTIQGEGFYQGSAAYFIRLGGCDVGCVWCDVKESWDVNAHPSVSVDVMMERAKTSGTEIVVITGGEPAMHDLTALTQTLKANGMRTHIETSGVYPLTGQWDWVCFSPKKFKEPHPSVFVQADELKVIVYNKSDFAWAAEFAAVVRPDCQLYLQPEWSKEKEMLPLIIDYVKANPQWQVSLQVHKYMNIP